MKIRLNNGFLEFSTAKGLVTHNDILKIYRTIVIKKIFLEYFETIFEIYYK